MVLASQVHYNKFHLPVQTGETILASQYSSNSLVGNCIIIWFKQEKWSSFNSFTQIAQNRVHFGSNRRESVQKKERTRSNRRDPIDLSCLYCAPSGSLLFELGSLLFELRSRLTPLGSVFPPAPLAPAPLRSASAHSASVNTESSSVSPPLVQTGENRTPLVQTGKIP